MISFEFVFLVEKKEKNSMKRTATTMPWRLQKYMKKSSFYVPRNNHLPTPSITTSAGCSTTTTFGQASQDMLVLLLNRFKKNGHYLEIGSNDPIQTNNTYLLEKEYQWRGIMVEIDPHFAALYKVHRPLAVHLIGDASQFSYSQVLQEHHFPTEMDYLQIDLDVENRSTLQLLELFDKTVFPYYKFRVLTFEHDIYRGDFFSTQATSRAILQKHGYVRLFNNVSVFFENKWCPFEDWYVHSTLIDPHMVQQVLRHPDNKENLPHTSCIHILQSIFHP